MDWRTRVMIIASIHLIILRLRLMIVFMCYYMVRKRNEQIRKRKRNYSYSMIDRIPEQLTHLRKLVHLNDTDCIDLLRMDRNTFHRLCYVLEVAGGLTNSRYVSVQEQVASFLLTLAHHSKNRVVRFGFSRSGQTVSNYFNKCLEAVCNIHEMVFAKPTPISADCANDRWKSFQGCLGALDGTYVKIRVPVADKLRYRSRKGDIVTNVLGVCDINLNFIYILSGWEGSCADQRVLRESVHRPTGLKVPTGNYYLCDLGYKNQEGFLTPYKGRRYHLEEWSDGNNRPRDKEEYFNMKHSKARNVIERAFGLLKIRWPILQTYTHYSVETRNRIIQACAVLHNFIRLHMATDPMEGQETRLPPQPRDEQEYIETIGPSREWHNWRENLANDMYENRRRTRI